MRVPLITSLAASALAFVLPMFGLPHPTQTRAESQAQNPSVATARTKRVETCERCWALILKGRLIDTFEFSQCAEISGMTCHITLKAGAELPSRVFVQALDSQDKPLGKKHFLPYPELKPSEAGWTSFPYCIPAGTRTVVLPENGMGPIGLLTELDEHLRCASTAKDTAGLS
jgi:hypothetical protein